MERGEIEMMWKRKNKEHNALILWWIAVTLSSSISCQRPSSPTSLTPEPPKVVATSKPSYKLNNGAPLDEKMAIAAAEKFIVDNGYTDLPPLQDETQISYEPIERKSAPGEILQTRHNTLERKAYSIGKGRKGSKLGWTVGFRYKGGDDKSGRAVTMDLDGGNIRVEHVDLFLQKLEKKLVP